MYSLIFLLVQINWANTPPTCQSVQLGVNAVLGRAGEPQSGSVLGQNTSSTVTTQPSSLSKFGLKDRDPNNSRDVASLQQDASYLMVRQKQAPEKFNEASDKMLEQINQALANPSMETHHFGLKRAKEELLQARYMGRKPPENMSASELKSSIDQLQELMTKAGIKSFDTPPTELAAEHELLKKLTKIYDKTPEARAAQQAMLASARADFRSGQNQVEMTFRSTKSPAAQPLTPAQATEIEQLTQTLKVNPTSLTPDQARKLDELRRTVREKMEWKEGQYSGLTAQDKKRAEEFTAALDRAADQLNRQSSGMINLAEQQGRTIKFPTVDTNRVNSFGERSRENLISARGASMARPDAEVIMTDLRKASPSYDPRLEQLVQFKPVIGRGDTMKKMEDSLTNLGITKDEIHSANVASTVDILALEKIPGTLERANSFAQKIYNLSQQGRLQQVQEQLGSDGKKAVQELIQVIRQHQKDYIPPHLRIKKFNE